MNAKLTINLIAKCCHEANRAYCEAQGDTSQVPWKQAPDWQKESCVNGVLFHLTNPTAHPSAGHDCWMAEKLAAGWTHGEKKDFEQKTHPCLVPFAELKPENQFKDVLFLTIVRALTQ